MVFSRKVKKGKPDDETPRGQDDISDCSSLSQSHYSPGTTQPTNTAKLTKIKLSEKEEADISIFVQPGGDRIKLPPDLPSEDTVTDECSQTGIEVEAVEFSSKKKQVNVSNDDRDLHCPRRMMLIIVAFVVVMTASAVVGFWAFRTNKTSSSSSVASLVSSDEVGAEVVDVNTNSNVVVDLSLKDTAGEINSARDGENDIKEEINKSNKENADTNYNPLLWSDSATPPPTTAPISAFTEGPIPQSTPSPAAEADLEPATEADPLPVAEADPLPATEADPLPITEADPLPIAEADPLPATEADPLPIAEADPLPIAEADLLPIAEADPLPVAEADPLPVAEADPTPSPSLGPTRAPTLEPSVSGTDGSTSAVTTVVTTDGTSSSNCPDHSIVASSNCAEDSATAFSTVLFCFASKRDGDWYWIRSSDDSDDTRGYDSWDYTDETEGQLTLLDLGKGNYLVSLVRDSMRPYDIITTHNFTVPECVAQ